MSRIETARRAALIALPVIGITCLVTFCRAQGPRLSRDHLEEPVLRVARASANLPAKQEPREHPLAPVVKMAKEGLEDFQKVKDYSATMVKRERVNGKLLPHEYMFVKIRHEQREGDRVVVPFAVYMYFLGPDSVKGREVIWIKGQNGNKLIGHETGPIMGLVTAFLDPESDLAMRNNRYPITDVGIMNLVEKLVEVGERDMDYAECEVKWFDGAKINGRECKCVQIIHPVPRRNFRFHKVQIFIDKELWLPVRYASWDWPSQSGGKPPLLEEYTYLNIKLNNGFTDADFDWKNPNYAFPQRVFGQGS
jgi:hypothetical protein